MDYAIIPTVRVAFLTLHYKVMNQIFKGDDNGSSVLLPFLMLEDRFSQAQKDEITLNEGIVFGTKEDYCDWLENQKETI